MSVLGMTDPNLALRPLSSRNYVSSDLVNNPSVIALGVAGGFGYSFHAPGRIITSNCTDWAQPRADHSPYLGMQLGKEVSPPVLF